MEKQVDERLEIFGILDEIIEVNESILSISYHGYNDKTIENLKRYKSTLQKFAKDAMVNRTSEFILN